MDFLVPVSFFVFLAAVIIAPPYLRYRERLRLMDTVRLAYERGQPLPPEMVDAVLKGPARDRLPRTRRDLRSGAILVAIAFAIIALGAALDVSGDASAGTWPLIGVAAFPGFVGLTLIGLDLLERRGKTL